MCFICLAAYACFILFRHPLRKSHEHPHHNSTSSTNTSDGA
jgi:hypothetical protein